MADDSMSLFDSSVFETPISSKRKRAIREDDEDVFSMSILDGAIDRLIYNHRRIEASQSSFLGETQGTNGTFMKSQNSFFGLPSKVRDLLETSRGIHSLYDWQKECLSMVALQTRRNLIYSLPTSGGKTLVAEILALQELLLRRKNVIFILPYVAIVQEKVRALSDFGIELGFLVEEYAGSVGVIPPKVRRRHPSIFIATIEKAHFLVNSLIEAKRLDEVGLVIVDELHMIGDGSFRGAGLEILLVKLKTQSESQIIGMSATIGNLKELAEFLNAETYTGSFRPVELVEHILMDRTLLEVTKSCELRLKKTLISPLNPEQLKCDADHITVLVEEVVPTSSVLVFCPTRKNCENVAVNLSRFLSPELKQHKVTEKVSLLRALNAEASQVCPILQKTIPFGVAYHHSGLTNDERKLVEEAYLEGTLCCLCCTSTLAAGVNLPAKRVILKTPYIGNNFLTPAKYKQMIGRAGRAGLDTSGESILICKPNIRTDVMKLLRSPVENCLSSLGAETLETLAVSVIGLRIVTCTEELKRIFQSTLMAQQNRERPIDELVSEAVNSLRERDLLEIDENNKLRATALGRASFKGVVDPCKVAKLYKNLELAMCQLSLKTRLHLIHVIAPTELLPTKLKPMLFFDLYEELTKEDRGVAIGIGVTENLVMRLRTNKSIKDEERQLLLRFYVTLQLNDLWRGRSVWQVAERFEEHRGSVQNLLSQALSNAMSISQFCEDLPEFWALSDLLPAFIRRFHYCSCQELVELMELPTVKRGRARQLYSAGFKSVAKVAQANPAELVKKLDHMPRKVATQIVSAAKHHLLKKGEDLHEEGDLVQLSFITL